MVPGIPPREASDRLGIFQARFDELWRKYETYSGKNFNTVLLVTFNHNTINFTLNSEKILIVITGHEQ